MSCWILKTSLLRKACFSWVANDHFLILPRLLPTLSSLRPRLRRMALIAGDKRTLDDDDISNEDLKRLRSTNPLKEPAPVPDLKLEPVSDAIRKRKVAVLVAYCGSGYYGLQVNQGFRTIEGDFVQALVNSGLITDDNAADLRTQTGFQRASRTDKGVSAAGNVFSLKMKLPDDAVERLNRCLPPQIRVLGAIKVTKGFDSKNSVNSRTYLYMLPTFSFAPIVDIVTKDYRVDAETIERVNKLFALYKGTRNYHNFTSGKLATDPSSKRFVMNIKCDSPFVVDGMEFAVISVRGQSFMLHQIRKMIGLVIAVAKGACSHECLTEKVWRPAKVDIPKAPGLGLMLDKLHYDTYNRKFGNDGTHQPLDWDDYKIEMDAFKYDQVFANIAKTEIESMEMLSWLATLTMHSYDVKRPTLVEQADVEPKEDGVEGEQTESVTGDEKQKDIGEETQDDNKQSENLPGKKNPCEILRTDSDDKEKTEVAL